MKQPIRRVGVVNATPYERSGQINEYEYRRHINWLAESGIALIHPGAATGQVLSLRRQEYETLLRWTVEELGGDVHVAAYAGRASTDESVELVKTARDVGCDSAFIMQPYFVRPSEEGIYSHYAAIAEAVPNFPLVFYCNPYRAGSHTLGSPVVIPISVMQRLVGHYENFVGLKEGEIDQLADAYRLLGGRLVVMPAEEKHLLYGLSLGCSTILSHVANVIPRQVVEIVECWERADHEEARRLFLSWLPLMNAIHIEPNPAPVIYMLNQLGWSFGTPRLPIVPVSRDSASLISQVFKTQGLSRGAIEA